MSRPALLALYFVASLALCAPLFAQPLALGVNDWDQHLFYYGAVMKNVVEYGQMPFWNPWYCAGNVLWQNPQIALLSPVYPLSMVMPLQLAMKVNIVLHYWVGFVGAHLLIARGIGLAFTPLVVFLATLIAAAGATALHLTAGHSVFLPGLYLPLLVYCHLRALNAGALRHLFLAAALLALMVFNGGVHILPMVVAALGSLGISLTVLSRSWRPLLVTAAFFAAGLAYAAPKLLPVSLYVTGDPFWDTRNATDHPDRMTIELLRHTYLDPYQHTGLSFELQRHRWQEYGNYIGPLAALLITVAVGLALFRRARDGDVRSRALALSTLVLFALSLGEFSPLAPASLVTSLPLFSSFRIPSRYTIPFVVFGAITVGAVARSLIERRTLGRSVSRTTTVICILAALQLLVMNQRFFVRVFRDAPTFDTRFQFMGGPAELVVDRDSNPYHPGSPMLRALMAGQSFFNCYESLQLTRTADDDHPLVYTEGSARISNIRFSPNRIDFDASAGPTPSRVFLNQNFAHGWSSDAGPVAREAGTDRLSTTLGSGQTGHFSFTFVPPGLWLGTAIAAIAFAVSIVLRNSRIGWRRASQ